MGDETDPAPFDEDFVRQARYRESDLPAGKPSRESLREVKREARSRRRAGRRRTTRRIAGAGIAVVTVAAVVLGIRAAAVRLPRRTAKPQVPVASHLPTASPTPDDPFAGTVVETWPVGAAGLRPPPARAKGPYSAAQVRAAYTWTTRYLRAAMLDPAVLYERDLEPVYAVMREDNLRTWRANRSRSRFDEASLANRFHAGVAADRKTIKVNGVMSTSLKDGSLWVHYTYVAAYALRPAKRGSAAELVAVRRDGELIFDAAGPEGVTKPWVRPSSHTSDHSKCGATWPHPGFVQVWFTSAESVTPEPTATDPTPLATWDMLDPSEEKPTDKRCFHIANELG